MAFESNTGLGVNNHYGQRVTGGYQGVTRTEGIKNEAAVNFDGDALGFKVEIPAAVANYVAITTEAVLTITGPTAGSVYVYYLNQA